MIDLEADIPIDLLIYDKPEYFDFIRHCWPVY